MKAALKSPWPCWRPRSLHRSCFSLVTFFTGVSKYIFTPTTLGVVLSIFASYFFAMTVVPLFCAKFISLRDDEEVHPENAQRGFAGRFERFQHPIPANAQLV